MVYELTEDESINMTYKAKHKIQKHFDCNLLVICASNIILCKVICNNQHLFNLLFNLNPSTVLLSCLSYAYRKQTLLACH